MRITILFGLLLPRLALAQVTPEERTVLEALDATQVVTWTRRLSEEIGVGPSGAGFGTAVAGSASERALADSIEGEMKGLGLEVTREPFPVRAYDHGVVSFQANGDRIEAITLHESTGTWGTRDGVDYTRGNSPDGRTLRVPLVDVGVGFAADYERVGDVTGKMVLVRRTVWPSATALEASVRGASAVVFYDYPGENPDDALKQDAIQYHDDLPAIAITKQDARRLLQMLSRGDVEVALENRVDMSYGVSENVIGRVAGSDYPDEFIAVSAHHDRWHQGAQDDAVGVAVLLELARVLKSASPRRTLLAISFGSEEAGGIATQSDWLTGSYAFVKRHPEVTSRLAYAFNVDGAGWSAEKGHVFATLDNLPFQRRLLEDLGLDGRIELHEGVTNWVDAWSLGAIGGGTVSYLLWFTGHPVYEGPTSFSRYYHTQLDVYRPRDYQNLDVDLSLGALGMLRADRAEVLPISLTEAASWTARNLEADAERAKGVDFTEAQAAVEAFARAAETVERGGGASAVRTNRTLMNARHELLPWLLSGSSEKAVLKTSPYAAELEAWTRAREAIRFGDAAMAVSALEEGLGLGYARRFSRESYRRERVYNFGPASWGNDFEQDTRSVSPEVFDLHDRLARDGVRDGDLETVDRLRAQSKGHLEEVLLLLSGKLRQTTRQLSETSAR